MGIGRHRTTPACQPRDKRCNKSHGRATLQAKPEEAGKGTQIASEIRQNIPREMTSDIAELLLHQAFVNSLRKEFLESWEMVEPTRRDDIDDRDDCWRGFLDSRIFILEQSRPLN